MANTLLELYHSGCRVNSEFSLRDITFSLSQGQSLVIMGKNASGKSTLFSMLMGIFHINTGEMRLLEKTVKFTSTEDSVAQGLLLLGQNQPVFENMNVHENIYFGHEIIKGKLLDNARMRSEAANILKELQLPINESQSMMELGQAGRQMVSLARAMCSDAKLILIDEPSTYLDHSDKKILWQAICRMKAAGKTFLIVTHDPEEALAVGDYIAFMEDGILSAPQPSTEHTEASLLVKAYGITTADLYAREHTPIGKEIVLNIELDQIDFKVARGEIVALVGDSDMAQSLMARIGGLVPYQGTITVCKHTIEHSVLSAISAGVSLALDDNAELDISAAREMLDNGGKSTGGANTLFKIRRAISGFGSALSGWAGVRRKQEYAPGGHRRRELMECALSRRASLYALVEPSAGLDLPSRMRMYSRFDGVAKEQGALLFSTSNLAEAVGLADRVIILRDGKMLCDSSVSSEDMIRYMLS